MQQDFSYSERPSTLSLKTIVAVLFRRKFLILSIFSVIVAAVALFTLYVPRQYESHMKVLVKNERADLVVSPDAREAGQIHSEVSEAQVNSEIELLTSDDLLAKVVRTCRLFEGNTVHAVGEPSPKSFEKAVRKLQRDLKIAPVRKANIIQITYSAASPELAVSVLKELSSTYLDAHLRVHRTAGSTGFFQDQAKHYETELHDAEDRLSGFRRQNGITSIPEQKDLMLRKVLDADAALQEANTGLAESASRAENLQVQLASLERRIVTQSRVLPNQYSVERLNTMLAELQNRRTQALMKFASGDRVVLELEQEIASTRAALDRAAKLNAVEQVTGINPVRQDLEAELAKTNLQVAGLKARRSALTAAAAQYHARLAQLEGATVEQETLERNVKQSEENYLLYSRKQEEARIADSLDRQKISNVAIAEPPAPHYLPAKPNVPLNLAVGIIGALLVALGAAFAAEYWRPVFHAPHELEFASGLPVLASIPYHRRS